MKMNIKEWANVNNMTPEEFKLEITKMMAAVGGIELDSEENKSNSTGVSFTVEDNEYSYKVVVMRELL